MITKIRNILLAVAFAATAAAGVTTAALSGQTEETDIATVCATSAWPNIPAECLEGDTNGNVRYVSMAADSTAVAASEITFGTVAILPTERFVPFWGNSAG